METFNITGKTKSGVAYTIRDLDKRDVNALLLYINKLSKEKTFILLQGEQLTLKDEEEFVSKIIKEIGEKKAVCLVIEADKKIIGIAQVNLKPRANSHVGGFGISVDAQYRDEGLGKLFLNTLIDQATRTIPELKIIDLSCFVINEKALHIYKSVGFVEYGRLPGGIKYKGNYIDEIFMYKVVR